MLHHRLFRLIFIMFGFALLSACSSYAPPQDVFGMTLDTLVARMGQPNKVRQLEVGSRLEFTRGPYGKQTWFVYFDAAGLATRAEQVLTEQNFSRIGVGMAQDEVLRLLGRPSEEFGLARARGVVWSYRYDNYACNWFQIELSQQQVVRSAGYGTAPECEKREGLFK